MLAGRGRQRGDLARDAAGNYSEYGTQSAETFLRGIQTTNGTGEVVFTTIYPGWYQGRATHIHLEVTIGGVSRKVTQIAFPESINDTVHRSGAYASRGTNSLSNARDGIFADSLASEIVTPVGDPTSGYTATFQVGSRFSFAGPVGMGRSVTPYRPSPEA